MNEKFGGCYLFIIDTDTYAGNFERQLAAYCTGVVGECTVGTEEATLFKQECPDRSDITNIVDQKADEHGCFRPVTIWETPGYWNDGLGSEWPDSEWGSEKAIKAYQKSQTEYRRYLVGEATSTPEKYPAYLSVAIYFRRELSQEECWFLMNRAIRFKTAYPKEISNILGFRHIQTVIEEKELWGTNHHET